MYTFDALGLKPWLLERLKLQHIKSPTPIQTRTFEDIFEGKDVIAKAPTGTGKTFAYLLPTLNRLDANAGHVQMLVLAPTRELALQITEEAKQLITDEAFTILTVYGGVDTQSQLKKLNRGIDIIIATPGRLIDFLTQGVISLKKLSVLVLDEADQMLLLGFKNEVEHIISMTEKEKQMLCFSATIGKDVKKLAYRYMDDPIVCEVDEKAVTLEHIAQSLVITTDRWKTEALVHTLVHTNPYLGIIFCRTIRRVDKLEVELAQRGIDCQKLHGDLSQNVRQRVVKAFREGKFQYLITTDVAARGIDISGISHIYNYDLPETSEIYIHRMGRSGRMGVQGHVVSFVAAKDEAMVTEIEKDTKQSIPRTYYERPEGFVDTTHKQNQ